MKLLLVTTSYPDRDEGASAAGMFVMDFARELMEENHAVSVIAPGHAARMGYEDGVRVQRFAAPRLPLSLLRATDPRDWRPILKTLLGGQKAVSTLCDTTRFDHILALWALPSGEWARRAGRRHGIPYSVWALGSDIWSLGRIPIIRGALRSVLQHATLCFADGYRLAEDVEQISGRACQFLPSSRRLTIDSQKALRQAPPYRLAYLGRWHVNKGIDLLMRALESLESRDWNNIEAIRIFGGGPLEREVNDSAKRLKSKGHPIEIGGYLDRTQATELLTWADYVVIPSRVESIPVIFSDAMQADCPVVATPVGDFPRMFSDYRPGVLCRSHEPEDICHGLQEAIRVSPATFRDAIDYWKTQFDVRSNAQRLPILISRSSME